MTEPPGQNLTAAESWRAALIRALAGSEPIHDREQWLVPGLTLEESHQLSYAFPPAPRPAAVLIPIVDHPDELTMLLTTRATQLRNHAGQISFPGGSLEPGELPLAAALREAQEEIGLASSLVDPIGYLPDHILLTGFRVTPVVALVRPGFEIQADATEVHDVFEVPLTRVLTASNYQRTLRRIGRDRIRTLEREIEIETHAVEFEGRNIWGATAGILLNLAQRCEEAAA